MGPSPLILKIHPLDNVGVALSPIQNGQTSELVTACDFVPSGHKIALTFLGPGEQVIKYGYPIGVATRRIQPGEHVHVHNVRSALTSQVERQLDHKYGSPSASEQPVRPATFDGYRRRTGSVGIRNEIWIINTVGCVNHVATRIAEYASRELLTRNSGIDGIYTFNHAFGCSQLGEDLEYTQRLLAGLAMHPNAAGVLVLGLGCENNQLHNLLRHIDGSSEERFRTFSAQDVDDELKVGLRMVRELAEYAEQFRREPIAASELILGMKCGGSDGLSGITANPLVGRIADRLAAAGGTSILTEVPEMFGAEDVLLRRAANPEIASSTVSLVNAFREYFRRHNQPIDENPSPGNKEGGITTLAEKSLGCVQKGGTFPIKQVLDYGRQALPGLGGIALLNGPGNDGVAGSALCAAGAHMMLFTTGRGTPLGFPIPTVKISTNTALAEKKPGWIDFDAGPFASANATVEELSDRLFEYVLDVASGRSRTKSEHDGFREISIWKDGVTL